MSAISRRETPVIRVAGADSRGIVSARSATNSHVYAVGSTGVPALEPLVLRTEGGETAAYAACDAARIDAIIEDDAGEPDALAEHDAVVESGAVVEHASEATDLPALQLPGLATGRRRVLGGCGWRRPTEPADHEAAGGFEPIDTEAVLDVATTLRGRGWGDLCQDAFVADTWETVRETDGDPAVVVNAHGTAADTLLLSSVPFEVLEGAVAAGRAVEASEILVYVSAADEAAAATARRAAEAYPESPIPIDVVTGPDSYRAAEPTMALEALEGNHRLEARLRPPGPERVGLHGRPTLLHTPRTLAQLSVARRTGSAQRTRLLTVDGDIETPATVELAESESLSGALDAVDVEGSFKAARVGGRFGGITDDLDVSAGPDALAERDLGTEGTVHVLNDEQCLVEFVGQTAQFAAEENCGRCVPCREGTTQLAELLRDVYGGSYRAGDIEELLRVMSTASICAFGVEAARPVRTAMATFEASFEAHADGRCPAGQCLESLEVA